jgi:hypothetical protein
LFLSLAGTGVALAAAAIPGHAKCDGQYPARRTGASTVSPLADVRVPPCSLVLSRLPKKQTYCGFVVTLHQTAVATTLDSDSQPRVSLGLYLLDTADCCCASASPRAAPWRLARHRQLSHSDAYRRITNDSGRFFISIFASSAAFSSRSRALRVDPSRERTPQRAGSRSTTFAWPSACRTARRPLLGA